MVQGFNVVSFLFRCVYTACYLERGREGILGRILVYEQLSRADRFKYLYSGCYPSMES